MDVDNPKIVIVSDYNIDVVLVGMVCMRIISDWPITICNDLNGDLLMVVWIAKDLYFLEKLRAKYYPKFKRFISDTGEFAIIISSIHFTLAKGAFPIVDLSDWCHHFGDYLCKTVGERILKNVKNRNRETFDAGFTCGRTERVKSEQVSITNP